MNTIVLATCESLPQLTLDDRLLAERLRKMGYRVQPAVWDARGQDLRDAAAVIIRSCWDYHLKYSGFLAWIDELERKGIPLWNPAETLRWNSNKTYLLEMEQAGFRVPPTVCIRKGDVELADLLRQCCWKKAVMKPTVSATSWKTALFTQAEAPMFQTAFEEILSTGEVVIQEFLPEIQDAGEWSFIFFDRRYSHCVLKRPQTGDFRVQHEFGGTVDLEARPAAHLISQAEEILAEVDGPLLYARVDGVQIDNRLCLMELECVEPALFLRQNPEAVGLFADAVRSHVSIGAELR